MGEERDYPGIDALTSTAALSGASRAEADALLKKQRELIDLQIEDLRREDTVRHWSLRVRHVSDVMKLAFELALAFIVVVIAVGLAAVVWSASHEDGLLIESFSVPPDMAARGLDGRVVASQLLDKLVHMQNQTASLRPARTFANNWGNDIKVQIPETGVSAGDAYRMLVQWLGHQTHISGEVFRTPDGIAVTARVGGSDGATFSGAEKDLDVLEQKAAEQIYAQTQPYRYAVYQVGQQNNAEAKRVFLVLAESDSSTERAWAHVGLGSLEEDSPSGDERAALSENRKAMLDDPDLTLAANNIAVAEQALGHDEARIAEGAQVVSLNEQGKFLNARCAAIATFVYTGDAEFFLGNFRDAEVQFAQGEVLPGCPSNADVAHTRRVVSLARQHDGASALAAASSPPDYPTSGRSSQGIGSRSYDMQEKAIAKMTVALARQDWGAIRKIEGAPGDALAAVRRLTAAQPLLALARAEAGDTASADALIAATPLDCYFCVRARGRIAAIERNWSASAHWFESATKLAPSLPTAFSEWGDMLLHKGDLDGAIAKFGIANQKGPRFADPLELWGEALMLKNRSDLALAKFTEANQYAPNWGRLHLKWGEALRYAGQPDEANRRFAIARGLFLTAPEHSALARDRGTHG
jgi:tetratricopeptide (TPR) repeat protein